MLHDLHKLLAAVGELLKVADFPQGLPSEAGRTPPTPDEGFTWSGLAAL